MPDRPPRRADAFFAAVIDHPWLVLAAVAVVTLLAASQLPRTRVVTDLRSLIPRDDVYLDDAEVRKTFGLRDYVVVGVVREEGVFHEETLRHARRLAEEVAGVEGVLKVRSLFTEDNIRDTSAGLRIEPFLHEINAASVEAARQAVLAFPAAQGILVSQDATCTAILVEIEDDASKSAVSFAIQDVLRRVPSPGGTEVHISGLPVFEGVLGDYVLRDFIVMVPITMAVVALVLFAACRSVLLVAVSLVEVIVVDVWALGLTAALGMPLYLIHATMPVILIALAVADEIHIFSRYAEESAAAEAPVRDRVLATMREIARPVVLTSVTTAAGFLSFLSTSTRPFQCFGAFTAVGILGAMVFSLTVTPIALVLWAPAPRAGVAGTRTGACLRSLGRALFRRRRAVAGAAAVLLAVAALGIRQVYIQDSFISNFKRSSPVRRSNAELNRRLSGTRMFHVELDTGRPDGVKDPAFLRAVDRAQQDAQGLAGAGGSISLVQIVKKMNQELLGDYALPDRAAAVAQMLFLVEGKSYESLWDPTYRKARVTVFSRTGDYVTGKTLFPGLKACFARHLPDAAATYGGDNPLGFHWIDLLHGDLRNSLATTVVLVLAVSLVSLRSLRRAVLVLAPILFAIAMSFGAMGLLGVPIGVATSAFSSIILGVGVDYTIHLQSRYRLARKSASAEEAMGTAFATAGEAILWDVVVVVAGFLVLLLSAMPSTQRLGLIVSLGVVTSLVATFLLCPVLLVDRRRPEDAGG